MAKQYAILHVQKHSSTGGGLGNHIERTKGKEHTYPHADSTKKHLNYSYDCGYKNLTLSQAVSKRIENGRKQKTAVRKDAVKFLSLVLTGSPFQMKVINSDRNIMKRWLKENLNFLKENYGDENIVKFELHRDEKTPHIHAIIVPLTEDGRLSAKEVVGNRKKLKLLQDKYAEKMKLFDLERGERNTNKNHITTKEFYQELEKTRQEVQNIDFKKIKHISPRDKTKLIEKLLKTSKMDSNLEELNLKKGRKFKR